jgi:dipeptidyl aminopeptidase/acylaminoacyl peptidase
MSQSESKIIFREVIELNDAQNRMVQSGWGKNALNKTVVERMTYISEGLKVNGYVAYPKDSSKKYPCIIWNRGGIGEKGIIDAFTAKGIFGQMASWDYVVFASQYRGNAGGEGKDEFGGEDVNDVLNLIPLAAEFEITDTDKWGIEGWSRGGMMTYLTLTKVKERIKNNFSFKCAVVTGGIADLRCNSDESRFMRKLYSEAIGSNTNDEFNRKCESRSIVNFPERLPRETPILIMHGANDKRVLPHDSLDLSYHLLKYKIPFRLIMLEGGDHFMRKHREEADEIRRKWYEKFLK